MAEIKYRGQSAAERRDADGQRLYNLLALFDTRDGSLLADTVRAAREGWERSHPDMGPEEDAWNEFDALFAREPRAPHGEIERLRYALRVAHAHWDADRDAKVGKTLILALRGEPVPSAPEVPAPTSTPECTCWPTASDPNCPCHRPTSTPSQEPGT